MAHKRGVVENGGEDMIPYGKQFIDQQDIEAVVEVLKSDHLTTGPKVEEFEERLANRIGAKYVVAVANGTASLHLGALALLKKGDKVLTTPNSFVATSNAILYAGAAPVFIDIQEDGNIDLDKAIELVKKDSSIKALFGVHFSGNPLNKKKLHILKEMGVKILEDASHALGAKYKEGGEVGDCEASDITTFSFHPVKIITTAEGGAIATNDKTIYQKVKLLRTHGIKKSGEWEDNELIKGDWYYEMVELGFNYRLSELHSVLGISQLKKLDSFLKRRKEIASFYDRAFKNSSFKPLYPFNPNSAYHLYVLLSDIPKKFIFEEVKKRGVSLQVHYIPINKQPYYQSLGYGDEELPKMYRYYQKAFSIPIFPSLEKEKYVVEVLKEVEDEFMRNSS